MLQQIREIYKSLAEFEKRFEETNRVTVNEALILSVIKGRSISASQIASEVSMTPSNASKTLKNIEGKWLIERAVGAHDRRQMYFKLTAEGESLLNRISFNRIDMDERLERLLVR